ALPADVFTHLLVLDGKITAAGGGETVVCRAGDSVFFPAGTDAPALSGTGTVLLSCPKGE
ncbi:MAG: DUF861 domain-containing protein, partial [Clostridia bacterium]|nr:DUF861 domain-containing protein [Clostridia bacterium]